jgi:Rrf2 family iron-sulfur cluster assembly transcriptional regulator
MLSNSCKYGIRAVVYIASRQQGKTKTGIKQISKDLGLPTPFLAKILQQLARQKILDSSKGPHGGFSLLKEPEKITLLDIVRTIDGDDIFTNCIIHNETCKCLDDNKNTCVLHDDYTALRRELVDLFSTRTISDIVKKAGDTANIIF